MNLKSELYGTGALGPPALFSTRDGKTHQLLRKALGGSQVCKLILIIIFATTNLVVVYWFLEKDLGRPV
jgi:hypothetical protein